eukprot:m.194698 g.194698  ORF g.194698 m.194698 type:complete len:61 (+) comp39505_c2_seq10:239-421(+)
MKLCGWSYAKTLQFLFKNGGKGVFWKFSQLVEDWKGENPQGVTIGQLLEALDEIDAAGRR